MGRPDLKTGANRRAGRGRTFAGFMPAALLLASVSGCDLLPFREQPDVPRTIAAAGTFEIQEGTSVRLGRGGPLLSFEEVSEDSRCPSGVLCIWAGVANTVFHIAGGDGETRFVLTIPGLTSTPYEENDEVPVQGLVFKLLELRPYPVFHYPDSDRDNPTPPARAVIQIEKPQD